MAYLYLQDIPTLLMDAFKAKLQKQMLLARQHYLTILEHDERLAPLLKNISDVYLGKDYSNHQTKSKHGKINLAELDILAKKLNFFRKVLIKTNLTNITIIQNCSSIYLSTI